MEQFNKKFIAIRYWLVGMAQYDKKYFLALKALEYAKNIHTGVRKDKVTPEFQHQIEIAQYIRTLKDSLLYPAETIAVSFLHDTPEDYGVSFVEMEKMFGTVIATSAENLNKINLADNTKKDIDLYFKNILLDPIASIVKGADRINNQQTMNGVFSYEKQLSYTFETEKYILPMLKEARRIHLEQESAYENIKFVLSSQIHLVKNHIFDDNVKPLLKKNPS